LSFCGRRRLSIIEWRDHCWPRPTRPGRTGRPLLELGWGSAALVTFAFVKRPHGISAVLARLLPRIHPRVTVKPLEPILGGEIDDVTTVGRVTELHPQVPDSRRLEKLLATGIGQRPPKRHQLAAFGPGQALKSLG
jgi:hypothetical protein